jgi:hypothetical protein
MTETQKSIREYLAKIGRRGGPRQPARTDQIARAANGRYSGDETRGDQSGQIVVATRSQITQVNLTALTFDAS